MQISSLLMYGAHVSSTTKQNSLKLHYHDYRNDLLIGTDYIVLLELEGAELPLCKAAV